MPAMLLSCQRFQRRRNERTSPRDQSVARARCPPVECRGWCSAFCFGVDFRRGINRERQLPLLGQERACIYRMIRERRVNLQQKFEVDLACEERCEVGLMTGFERWG